MKVRSGRRRKRRHEVEDRGPAIPAEELSQVFSPDYRGRTRGWSASIRLQYVRQAVEALGDLNREPVAAGRRVPRRPAGRGFA